VEYAVIGWIAGAAFVAFVARRLGRRPMLWFLVGLALPLASIAVVYAVGAAAERPAATEGKARVLKMPRKAPKRCCGRYIGDCHVCPFFRGPKLFSPTDEAEAGYCERFERTLWKDSGGERREG
jgi:hypothetical protein